MSNKILEIENLTKSYDNGRPCLLYTSIIGYNHDDEIYYSKPYK